MDPLTKTLHNKSASLVYNPHIVPFKPIPKRRLLLSRMCNCTYVHNSHVRPGFTAISLKVIALLRGITRYEGEGMCGFPRIYGVQGYEGSLGVISPRVV